MKKLEQKFASLQIVKIIEKLGNEKVFFFICFVYISLYLKSNRILIISSK